MEAVNDAPAVAGKRQDAQQAPEDSILGCARTSSGRGREGPASSALGAGAHGLKVSWPSDSLRPRFRRHLTQENPLIHREIPRSPFISERPVRRLLFSSGVKTMLTHSEAAEHRRRDPRPAARIADRIKRPIPS